MGGISLVLPPKRMDQMFESLLKFASAGSERNDSAVAIRYFAIRCITYLASHDRYCMSALERVQAKKRLEIIAEDAPGGDMVLPKLVECAVEELEAVHPQLLPTWRAVSMIEFEDARTYAAILHIGDSREPDQHWFSGRRRYEGHFLFGRISWNFQEKRLKVPEHALDIQYAQFTKDKDAIKSTPCDVLMGEPEKVRWLDIPVGHPFKIGDEHIFFEAGKGPDEKPTYIAAFTVAPLKNRWNPGYIQEGMLEARQDWSFGLQGSPKCSAVRVLVSAF